VTAQESPLKRQKVEFNVDEIGCYHASFKDGLIAAEQYERALQHLCKGSSSAWHLVYRAGFIDAPKFMVECEKLVKSGEINLLTFTKDMLRTLKLDEGEEAECIMMFVDEVCELFPDKTVLFCTVLRALIENGETETKALNYVFPCIGKELRGVLKIYQSLKTVLSDASMDMYNAKLFDDILDKMTGNLEEVLTECGEFKKEGLISESQYAAMVNKWFSMMQGSNRYALFMSKKFLKEAHQDYIIAHMSTIPSPAESKELYADGLLNEKNYDNILSKWVEKVEGPPVLVLKQGKEMVAQGLIKESHYQEMVKKCLPHCF
jgi:hypothetical protein